MSDCATTEKIMDLKGQSADYASDSGENDSHMIMGKMPLAMKVPTPAQLVPIEERRDVMSQAAKKNTVPKVDNNSGVQGVNSVILVKEALPIETVDCFVNQAIRSSPVRGDPRSADVQITASTPGEKKGAMNSGPVQSHRHQSVGEKSKSTSAVDHLADSPRHRRILTKVAITEAKFTDQRPLPRMDDEVKPNKNTVTEVTNPHVSGELKADDLQEIDERTDCSSDEESISSEKTLSGRSTSPRSLFDYRKSSRSHTPDSIISDRSLSIRYTDESFSHLSNLGKSSRSLTPDSIISSRSLPTRSAVQSSPQSYNSRKSSHSQTPDFIISTRSLSTRSAVQSSPQSYNSRKSSHSQTPDFIISTRSLSARSVHNSLPDSVMSTRMTPDSIISSSTLASRSTKQLTPQSSAISSFSRHQSSNSNVSYPPLSSSSTKQRFLSQSTISINRSSEESDCIVGPFPIFAPVPPRDNGSKELLSERSSIGSIKNSPLMQSQVNLESSADFSKDSDCIVGPFPLFAPERPKDVLTRTSSTSLGSHEDLEPEAYSSDDSDCIVGPFPLFPPVRPTEITTRTSSGSIGSHEDSEPEVYSSDDSDCIVGPFPLFAPVRPTKITTRTSSGSIGTHDDLEPEAYSSDDSDCIVGPFPLFAPVPSKEATKRGASSQSMNSVETSPTSSVKSAQGSAYSSDESDCIVGPYPIFAPVAPIAPCLSESNSSLSEDILSNASENMCDPKSLRKPTTCWTPDVNHTVKCQARTPGRLRRGFDRLRKGLRRLGHRFSNLATNCFTATK